MSKKMFQCQFCLKTSYSIDDFTYHNCIKKDSGMAEFFCKNCKEKFESDFKYETHVCKGEEKSFYKRFFDMIRCEKCGNKMSFDIYKSHACKRGAFADRSPANGMQIGVFVSSVRVDTSSMRLAATEFSNANYIVRGIEAEESFTRVAKEMKSSVSVAAAKTVHELDCEILKKCDLAIMFPSKKQYDGKDILKFPLSIGEKKVPVVVYPER